MSNEKNINTAIRLLLLGSDTKIGKAFIQAANEHSDFNFSLLTHDQFLQADVLQAQIDQYDVVLDALSIEAELTQTYMQQMTNWCEAISKTNISLFMLSSVAIFSGKKGAAYDEADISDADTKSGQQLAQIENLVLTDKMSVVLRSGWLFGAQEGGILLETINAFKAGNTVSLQDDIVGNPTPLSDLARVAFSMIKQRHYGAECFGVYHYACAEEISRYGFAEAISANVTQFNAQLQVHLEAVNENHEESNDVALVARQTLSCRKIFNHFGVKQRPWRASLRNLVKELYQTG